MGLHETLRRLRAFRVARAGARNAGRGASISAVRSRARRAAVRPHRPFVRESQLLVLLAALAAPVVLVFLLHNTLETLFGFSGVEDPGEDGPRMTAIVRQMDPVMDAAEVYRRTHGTYPASKDTLQGHLPVGFSVNARMGFLRRELNWQFLPSTGATTGYHLQVWLGRDVALVYHSSTRMWSYCSDHGAPKPLPPGRRD